MSSSVSTPAAPRRTVGWVGVFVAGLSLVVSSSTLVTEFTGFLSLGIGFIGALVIGFCLVLPLACAAADLSASHPRAGGIYHLARTVIGGRLGDRSAVFFAFCFFGTFLVAAAAETMAGAHALRSLVHSDLPVELFVVGIVALAVLPNAFGLRNTTWAAAALLLVMFGVRWYFGLAGFLGWSDAGAWSLQNVLADRGGASIGAKGILSAGLAFGFWTFVGVEGACSLAGETRNPGRSMSVGMILALATILVTTTFLGVGIMGVLPATAIAPSADSPQLQVGRLMFGSAGEVLMALASIASTLSTLMVALAGVPRMIHAMARDGLLFGRYSARLARLDPRTGVPLNATLAVAGICLVVTLFSDGLVGVLRAAAYLWFVRYLVIYGLAIRNRMMAALAPAGSRGALVPALAVVGVVATLVAFRFGFSGSHLMCAAKALLVVGGALVATAGSFLLADRGLRAA